jgi:radical S-adenosyl methionine domain-containing protein 2
MKAIGEKIGMHILNGGTPSFGRQIVINWHLTEACNYECDFCYAKWVKVKERELIHDGANTQGMLRQIFNFFSATSELPAAAGKNPWESVRLNFAGGEPLLYRKETLAAVKFAKDIGFEVSMITNGSLLDRPTLEELAPQLSLLGISLDSSREEVNLMIGRADKRTGKALGIDAMETSFRWAREFNPALHLKVNTVVNKLNWQEDMTDVIQRLAPGKWKVLQMLPIKNSNLAITDLQFQQFVDRNCSANEIMSVEDNASMTESYIMVDPFGRFYQNAPAGQGQYRYSRPVLQVGARNAFSEMSWSASKFLSRYAHSVKAEEPDFPQDMELATTAKYRGFPIQGVVAC